MSRDALYLKDVDSLKYSGYWAHNRQGLIENDGHTAKITFQDDRMRPQLAGGLLVDRYVFEQMHFHWGETDNAGSEHTIDEKM